MKYRISVFSLCLMAGIAHAADKQQPPVTDTEIYHAEANIGTPFPTRKAAVNAAVRAWEQGNPATPIMGQGGIMLYPYGQATPTLVCSPLRVCLVELQRGEVLESAVVGNSVQWQVKPTYSGAGASERPIVAIKPTQTGLETNLAITTNRRVYYINLKSADTGMIPMIGFYYPAEMVQTWQSEAQAKAKAKVETAERTVADLPSFSVEAMDFDYRIRGDAYFRPTQVFSVEGKTYIKMPPGVQYRQAPILLVQEPNGNTRIVNYQYIHRQWIIVDSLFHKANLVIGKGGDQVKVTVTHEGHF
jgi:type IV secretion system protein VirB9